MEVIKMPLFSRSFFMFLVIDGLLEVALCKSYTLNTQVVWLSYFHYSWVTWPPQTHATLHFVLYHIVITVAYKSTNTMLLSMQNTIDKSETAEKTTIVRAGQQNRKMILQNISEFQSSFHFAWFKINPFYIFCEHFPDLFYESFYQNHFKCCDWKFSFIKYQVTCIWKKLIISKFIVP